MVHVQVIRNWLCIHMSLKFKQYTRVLRGTYNCGTTFTFVSVFSANMYKLVSENILKVMGDF